METQININNNNIQNYNIAGDDPQQRLTPPHTTPGDSKPSGSVADRVLTTIANIFSGVFLPLLTPTYAYVIALWTTSLSTIPERIRFNSSVVIFVLTAVIPLATILFLMRRGRVSDVSISNPRERLVPYTVTILCYILSALYMMFVHAPEWLTMFFVGAFLSTVLASIINLWWKISAHCIALGGLCALLLFEGVTDIASVLIMPWITSAIVVCGFVGSARVYLGRHTQGQVYAGWALGLVCTFLCMFFG